MNTKISKITALIITAQLTFFSAVSHVVIADELINQQDLQQSIVNTVNTETSTISPNTSDAPQQSSSGQTQSNIVNTGDNVDANTSSNDSTDTTINNQNDTTVNQTINAEANTGYNTASGNISINGGGAGLIDTGDATVNATASVNAGSNTTGVSGSGGSGGSSSNVANTGNNLTSNTSSNSTMSTMVNNGNTTTINQAAHVSANTGYNTADGNIAIGGGPAGVINTGNASTNTNFLVTAGGNVTLIGGTGGNGPGDGASIVLANTGRNARFNTSANTKHYTIVTNENRAIISQTCGYPISPRELVVDVGGCLASTGGNTSNGNIAHGGDAGVITTSDAVVNVDMHADANNNTTVIDNGGACDSAAHSGVANTGDNVTVNTDANCESDTTVNNHNSAYVNQTVNATADTGHNTANGNIAFGGRAGVITTGDATVNVTMHADVNNNETAILGDTGDGAAHPASVTSVINTGDDVEINNSANSTSQTTVNNTNVLSLLQQVWSVVTTGFNSALGNIGAAAGIITTGDATSNTNMEVDANSNCTVIGGGDPSVCLSPTPITPSPTNAPAIGGAANPVSNPSTGGGGSSQGSSSSSSSSTSPSVASVLGAAILPATGPEYTIAIMLLSALIGFVGISLKRYARTH